MVADPPIRLRSIVGTDGIQIFQFANNQIPLRGREQNRFSVLFFVNNILWMHSYHIFTSRKYLWDKPQNQSFLAPLHEADFCGGAVVELVDELVDLGFEGLDGGGGIGLLGCEDAVDERFYRLLLLGRCGRDG